MSSRLSMNIWGSGIEGAAVLLMTKGGMRVFLPAPHQNYSNFLSALLKFLLLLAPFAPFLAKLCIMHEAENFLHFIHPWQKLRARSGQKRALASSNCRFKQQNRRTLYNQALPSPQGEHQLQPEICSQMSLLERWALQFSKCGTQS